MTMIWILASLHLAALAIGFWAVLARARALRGTLDGQGLWRVLAADNWWGIAALLWIGTGLLRAFGGYEKGTQYYLEQPLFHMKLGLVVLLLAVEAWPMITLIRWRLRIRRGEPVDTSRARTFSMLSHMESGLIVVILFVATALARGMQF